jgi:hypothetical protein
VKLREGFRSGSGEGSESVKPNSGESGLFIVYDDDEQRWRGEERE